jgi:hypothetical protein
MARGSASALAESPKFVLIPDPSAQKRNVRVLKAGFLLVAVI